MHAAYHLYKRKFKKGPVWYYKAYAPDGSLMTGKSTGCRTKCAAKAYCDNLLAQGLLDVSTNVTFLQYGSHFFDNNSIWVQDRKALGTPERPAISDTYIKKLQSNTRTYLLPFFGAYKLSKIKPTDVKKFRLWMLEKGLSPKTINETVGVFKTITDTALADGIIVLSPLRGIKPLFANPSIRSAFTEEQADLILNTWQWRNEDCRLFHLIGALTGMRKGEVLAIRRETVHENYIDVVDQSQKNKLVPLKTKEARIVPICPELYELITSHLKYEFLFDFVNQEQPYQEFLSLSKKYNFEEARKENGLCFHSWRHFYNTYLLSENINPFKVAAVLGHSTGVSSMQERYTNFTVANYKEVYESQQKLFNKLTKKEETEKIKIG